MSEGHRRPLSPPLLPLLLLLLVAPGPLPQAAPQRISYFPQIGDGRVGQLTLKTTFLLTNAGEDTTLKLEFFNSQGQPMQLQLEKLGFGSVFEIPLKRGQTFSAQTPGTGSLQVGYARLQAGSGVGGTAVFSRCLAEGDLLLYEAGVPASLPGTAFSLLVDSLAQKDTGLAVVNTGEEVALLTLRLYDPDFLLLALTQVVLAPGQHLARFVWEFFRDHPEVAAKAREMQGSLTLESTQPVAVVTLRQNEDPERAFPQSVPTLTAFPVVEGRADQEVPAAPYPPSRVIAALEFDFESRESRAVGSDNWPVTWAGDGHQYATWGDGGGFGGSNSRGRSSLGVARIEGDADNYVGFNRWGGHQAENPAQFGGKSYGIPSLEGVLYMWVSPGSGKENYEEARLAYSQDLGATWQLADWAFQKKEGFILPTFCQFGPDYQGARDGFVYVYAARLQSDSSLKVQKPGQIDLMRVPTGRLLEREAYRFFGGLDSQGEPIWVEDAEQRRPVFQDANGVGWTVSVSYNAPLGRYLLCTEHDRSFQGNLGIFDAPEPWGPWSTVAYYQRWASSQGIGNRTFFWNFSNKWLSPDGRRFVLIFSGVDEQDSWNTVRGFFCLTGEVCFPGVEPN